MLLFILTSGVRDIAHNFCIVPERARSGTIQKLWAMSLTPEVRINSNMVVRAEYRHDESDRNTFANADGASQSGTQDTLAFNALFYF